MSAEQIQEEEDQWDEMQPLEVRRCGSCGHFDGINQGCWVIASDGIFRSTSQDDYCVFNFKEELY